MKSKILGLLAVGLLAGPMAANAITYNFDMRGLTPGPTYSSVVLDLNVSTNGGGSVGCELYDGLDLTGDSVGLCPPGALFDPFESLDPEIRDGVFSMNLYFGGDIVQVGAPFVVGIKEGVSTATLFGVEPSAVPEPGTLALLGLGLAGLGLSRRRKAN